jgi:hypothetical protein
VTLVEFLLARLAEDQAAAQRALPGPWELQGEPRETQVFSAPTGVSVAVGWLRDLGHIARHDPARVLAEVAAKRRIVDEHWEPTSPFDDWPTSTPGRHCPTCWDQGERLHQRFPCPTLRLLALPYAGHPDYLEEWKP